jgi:hypothetical protein
MLPYIGVQISTVQAMDDKIYVLESYETLSFVVYSVKCNSWDKFGIVSDTILLSHNHLTQEATPF